MTSESSCAACIAARTRPSRASKTASGNSTGERAIRPRRIVFAFSRGDFEQLARRLAQHLGAVVGDDDGVAQHDISSVGMVGVGMHDQRHAGLEYGVDVFEDMRLGIGE